MKRLDLTNKIFGRLKVLGFAYILKGRTFWSVKCKCETIKIIIGTKLTSGHTQSCGCFSRDKTIERSTTHKGCKLPEYQIWAGIKKRCSKDTLKPYPAYKGRGIKVSKRWNKFENFLEDMGARPSSKHSIERIDNNGNYTPDNCRWATPHEQSRNKRNTVFIDTAYGKRILQDACMEYNISSKRITTKVWKYKVTHQDAFNELILQKGCW